MKYIKNSEEVWICTSLSAATSKDIMLKGVRVLDFTRLLPGPFATQILADLGAEVIKVEEPIMGDYQRSNPIGKTVDGNSVGFHALNRGKKSVSLNLKKDADREKLHRLIATSDVIVGTQFPLSFLKIVRPNLLYVIDENKTESFRPGVMEKLGFGPQSLLSRYPSLIVCSISGYGQNGPYRLKAGHDINYVANAGLLALSEKPHLPPAQIADLCGGAWPAALQVIAALYHRQNNGGKGNIIDVSMTDCSYALGVLPQSIIRNTDTALSNGRFVLNGAVPCYGVYPCKDGFISVGALEPKFWIRLCKVLNAKNLSSKGLVRGKEAEAVKEEVTRIFKTKTCAEWKVLLDKSDCCTEVVPKAEDVANMDLIKSRNLDVEVDVKAKGKKQKITVPKTPLNMLHGVEFQRQPGPSKIGEHNHEILSKL